MTTPDKPKPVVGASAERPETDLDRLLDDLALDLEGQLGVVVEETKQGIDAAKLAETQADTGIGGETMPKQRLKRDVPRKKIERGSEGKNDSEPGLIEAQALLREWSDIRLTAPDKRVFDAAVKTRLGIERLPNITTHQATVANLERRVRGEAVPGDDSVLSKTYDLQVWLPKYRALVEAARVVAAGFAQEIVSKPQVSEPITNNSTSVSPKNNLVNRTTQNGNFPQQSGANNERSFTSLDKPLVTHLELENAIINLRRADQELCYRDPNGDRFFVRSTKNENMFELRDEHTLLGLYHYRELATLLYHKPVLFEGKHQWRRIVRAHEVKRTLQDWMIDNADSDELRTWWDESGRTWNERLRFIQAQLNRWDKMVMDLGQITNGEQLLKKTISVRVPEYDSLARDKGARETWDLIQQAKETIDRGELESEEHGGLRNQLRQRCLAYQNILNATRVLLNEKSVTGHADKTANLQSGGTQSLNPDRQPDTRTRGGGEQLRSWGELKPEERGERAKSLERWCISFWQNLQGKLEEKGMKNRKQQAALIRPAYEKKLTDNIREKLSVHMTDEEMQSISRALEKVVARLQ